MAFSAPTSERPHVDGFEIIDAKFMFPSNFSGSKFRDGKRNITIKLTNYPDLVARLKAENWNVGETTPTAQYPDIDYYLSCELRFDNFPPQVIGIDDNHFKTMDYTEETVGKLDQAWIDYMDVVISPSAWWDDRSGCWRIKSYVYRLAAHLRKSNRAYSDSFDRRYGGAMNGGTPGFINYGANDDGEPLPFN